MRVESIRRGEVARLSVIVPAFNAESHLSKCVESILGQSFTAFELLLVNDGSTDATAELAERFSQLDSRIRVFHVENGGPSSARNFALKQALGAYVQFVDADDMLEPDCLKVVDEAMERDHPDVVIVGARIVDACMAETERLDVPGNGIYPVEELLTSLTPASKATLLHYVWNKWYRLSLIREEGFSFDEEERLGEDFLFNCDYWGASRTVCLVDEPLYRYCKRSGAGLTGRYRPDELSRRRKMDARLFALYEDLGIRENQQPMLEALVGSIALDSLSSVVMASCPLSVRGRVDFIRRFIGSEYGRFIDRYAASERLSVRRRLETALVRLRAPGGLYGLMWACSRLKALR